MTFGISHFFFFLCERDATCWDSIETAAVRGPSPVASLALGTPRLEIPEYQFSGASGMRKLGWHSEELGQHRDPRVSPSAHTLALKPKGKVSQAVRGVTRMPQRTGGTPTADEIALGKGKSEQVLLCLENSVKNGIKSCICSVSDILQ